MPRPHLPCYTTPTPALLVAMVPSMIEFIARIKENDKSVWEYLRMNEFIDMWSEFILIWYDFIPIWNEFIHECDSFLGNEEA